MHFLGIDDGNGVVSGYTEIDGRQISKQFYAAVSAMDAGLIPNMKRAYIVHEYSEPMDGMIVDGMPVYDSDSVLVGDAVFYNTSQFVPDTKPTRYYDKNALARIRTMMAELLNTENRISGVIKEDIILGLGANLTNYRTDWKKIEETFTGRHLFRVDNVSYDITVAKVVTAAQPIAALEYIKQQPEYDPAKSYMLFDIGTGTTDIVPIVDGTIVERASVAIPLGVDALRQEIQNILTHMRYGRPMTVQIENLLKSSNPYLPLPNGELSMKAHLEVARKKVWSQIIDAAAAASGVKVHGAFFVGGGALAFKPLLLAIYASQQARMVIPRNPNYAIAWGLYALALESRPEEATDAKKRKK